MLEPKLQSVRSTSLPLVVDKKGRVFDSVVFNSSGTPCKQKGIDFRDRGVLARPARTNSLKYRE